MSAVVMQALPPAVGRVIPADSVRRAVREVFAGDAYQWAPAARPLHWLRDAWLRFLDWLNRLDTQHPVLYRLLFWAAVLVLIALLTHLALTAWRVYRSTVERLGGGGGAAPGAAPVSGDSEQQLARAEALARAGRYTEALAHRFLALLLALDRVDALSFHPAKTPAEYVHEARLDEAGRASFAGLVVRLYTHVFGAAPCDAQGYSDFGATAGIVLQHAASH